MKTVTIIGSFLLAGSLVISAWLLRPRPTPLYELHSGKFCDYLINHQTGTVWRYYRNTNPTNEAEIIAEGFELLGHYSPAR
jgi:hypothetical protein